jgi:predicted S18 family serine protease
LRSQIVDLSSSLNELTESSRALEQQFNMSTSQIEYYKELALYYSSLKTPNETAVYVIGCSTIPIVAVQTVQNGFHVDYRGVVMAVDIELVGGSGRVLVDTVPKIGIDIQTSVRTAVLVAEKLTGVSLSKTDVILTIRSGEEVDVVDGQSAGAAITVALIAAMTNRSVNEGVYMTGTINADMSVGAVGGVPYKALAAAENGSKCFIVPKGQSTVVVYKPATYKTYGGRTITVYEKETMELEDYLKENGYSVEVLEVENIEEAYTLFID